MHKCIFAALTLQVFVLGQITIRIVHKVVRSNYFTSDIYLGKNSFLKILIVFVLLLYMHIFPSQGKI